MNAALAMAPPCHLGISVIGASMLYPWRELKQTEMMLLKQRCNGGMLPRGVAKLRRLFEQCQEMTDADESICYHGALALIHESDGKTEEAMKHRLIEIQKIERLHQLASQNVGDRAAVVPDPDSIAEWKRVYLEVWDGHIDSLKPKPDYKRRRREVIIDSFDRLERISRSLAEDDS